MNLKNPVTMKRNITLLALCTLAILAQAQTKQLTILHTNDTHSQIYPLTPNLTDTMLAGRGGFIRRIEMLKEERKKDPELLLFDSGDFSQGSPYYTIYKGDVETKLMNMMHYDAVTIGNHEFDFGLQNMARIFRLAKFPIVCANYDFTGTELASIVKPYVILKRKGLKIGVFGLAPKLDGLVMEQNYLSVVYKDPVAVAQKMVNELETQKCDLIICLSHLGWKAEGVSDEEVIANTRGIDLVLGGHSHSYFKKLEYEKNLDGKPIPVDQNGKHAVFVGKMILTFAPLTRNRKSEQ